MGHGTTRVVLGVVLAALLGTTTGCWPFDLVSNAASFAAGWLVRDLATAATGPELTCYRNGVAVDCADVPAEFLPASQ